MQYVTRRRRNQSRPLFKIELWSTRRSAKNTFSDVTSWKWPPVVLSERSVGKNPQNSFSRSNLQNASKFLVKRVVLNQTTDSARKRFRIGN